MTKSEDCFWNKNELYIYIYKLKDKLEKKTRHNKNNNRTMCFESNTRKYIYVFFLIFIEFNQLQIYHLCTFDCVFIKIKSK